MAHNKFPLLPAPDELEIDESTGFAIPPSDDIRVYRNGAGYSHEYTCMVYGPGTFAPNSTGITSSERGIELRQRRQELAEERIVKSIESATGKEIFDAFGDAYGLLFTDVVMNSDQPGRTRSDVLKELGKRIGIVPDRDRVYEEQVARRESIEGLTPAIALRLRELILTLPAESLAVEDEPQQVVDSSFVEYHQPIQENSDTEI